MERFGDDLRRPRAFVATTAALWLALVASNLAGASETVFLQDGPTIRADEVEIVGDVVRLRKPTETIELHRSQVLSIHRSSAPGISPGPADVYRDTTRQMNERVRGEIEGRPGARRAP